MSSAIEEFFLNSGWAGIVILGLLWFIREQRADNRALRAQVDSLHAENIRQRDETIRDLLNRGGLHHGGRHE